MPTKIYQTFTGTSDAVLNTIRNSASVDYREFVPIATSDAESVRTIGAIIMQYPALQNEFLNNLFNRIGREIITSRMYTNPLRMFKKGMLEFGETVEEIFVNIAKAHAYDMNKAATDVFNIEKPDVKAAFHIMNVQSFYKQTVSEAQLRQAFLSWGNMDYFIRDGIIASMYKAVEYDELNLMKYLIVQSYLNGHMPVTVVGADDAQGLAIAARAASTSMTFLSPDYNPAGVYNNSERARQYFIVPAEVEASLDVGVLAAAFHMDKAEFLGHVVPIDSFANIDEDRLSEIVEGFVPLDSYGAADVANLLAVVVDEDFFQIYDKLLEMRNNENSQGLYWNYNLHAWKIVSTSPFACRTALTTAAGAVSAVAVTPTTATLSTVGAQLSPSAIVTGTNGVDKSLAWSVSGTGASRVTVDPATGLLTYAAAGTQATVTLTATSKATPAQSGTCTVTLAATSA